MVAVFLYIKRPFVIISHVHILHGLQQLPLHGKMLRRIGCFLSNRKMFVITTEGQIQTHLLHQGVTQGSMLKPILLSSVIRSVLPQSSHVLLCADNI